LTFARHLDVLKIHSMRTDKMPQSNANAAIHAHCMNGRIAMMAVELSLRQSIMLAAISTKSFKRPPDAPVRAMHAIGANVALYARQGQRIPDAPALP
jgi:hypothetical protein